MSRLGANREARAVGSRTPGWGGKAAVTLIRALLREATAVAVVAVAVSESGESSLASLVGFLVGFDSPSPDRGEAKTTDGHAEDYADDGRGVCALGVAVVDVPGEQVGEAGTGVDRRDVGAVEAGAGAAVAHDPGRHGHVEAGDCRGHVGGSGGGAGVVVAVVDGGEMHDGGGVCESGGVSECGGLIGSRTCR